MSVRETGTTFSETIDVGGFDLRVSAQVSNPVVLVVDGDEQDVRFVGREQGRCDDQANQRGNLFQHVKPFGNRWSPAFRRSLFIEPDRENSKTA